MDLVQLSNGVRIKNPHSRGRSNSRSTSISDVINKTWKPAVPPRVSSASYPKTNIGKPISMSQEQETRLRAEIKTAAKEKESDNTNQKVSTSHISQVTARVSNFKNSEGFTENEKQVARASNASSTSNNYFRENLNDDCSNTSEVYCTINSLLPPTNYNNSLKEENPIYVSSSSQTDTDHYYLRSEIVSFNVVLSTKNFN